MNAFEYLEYLIETHKQSPEIPIQLSELQLLLALMKAYK